MAFGIGINTEVTDKGEIRGKQIEVAVGCWFTSTGNTIPQMVKWEDAEGLVHTIKNIRVLYKEQKNYAGVSTMEYMCEMIEEGFIREVKLIFFMEERKWCMLI